MRGDRCLARIVRTRRGDLRVKMSTTHCLITLLILHSATHISCVRIISAASFLCLWHVCRMYPTLLRCCYAEKKLMPNPVSSGTNAQGNTYTNYSNGGYSYNNSASSSNSGQGSHYYAPSGNTGGSFYTQNGGKSGGALPTSVCLSSLSSTSPTHRWTPCPPRSIIRKLLMPFALQASTLRRARFVCTISLGPALWGVCVLDHLHSAFA